MRQLKTDEELFIQNQQYAFKLRNLYLNDKEVFHQLNDYVPYSIYINNKRTLNINYANDQLLTRGVEMEKLINNGSAYLAKISCPMLLEVAKNKTFEFGSKNDINSVCSFLQGQKINGEVKYFYTSKLILDESSYFNVSFFLEDFGNLNGILNKIFNPILNDTNNWQKFQFLTKREKEVMQLISKGYTKKEISDQLFISQHSVHTHRRNIYSKLDVHNISDLIRYSILFDAI